MVEWEANVCEFPVDLSTVITNKDSRANQCPNFVVAMMIFCFQLLPFHLVLTLQLQSTVLDFQSQMAKKMNDEASRVYLEIFQKLYE